MSDRICNVPFLIPNHGSLNPIPPELDVNLNCPASSLASVKSAQGVTCGEMNDSRRQEAHEVAMFRKPSERMRLEQIGASCSCRCLLPLCHCCCICAIKQEIFTVAKKEHRIPGNKPPFWTDSLLTVLSVLCWMLYVLFPLARNVLQH